MHPFEIQDDLERFGFWYTYWKLRNMVEYTRWESVWMIWIAWNSQRHMERRLELR